MGGGRENLISTFTPAIVIMGNTSANTINIDPKNNFFILLHPILIINLSALFIS
jgi:hypothetical protein